MGGFATPKPVDTEGLNAEGDNATANPTLVSGVNEDHKITSLFMNTTGAPSIAIIDQSTNETLKEILEELKKMNFYLSNICGS